MPRLESQKREFFCIASDVLRRCDEFDVGDGLSMSAELHATPHSAALGTTVI